ncbi:MAG: amino acid ABC transporter substrate-binding protein [Rubellimicrobium sp.]|nr:amino acid ABC transporter substrate-binding protein [Rubellimicrobium sp.]
MIRMAAALVLVAAPAAAESLRICTEVDYPPYMAADADGTLYGFEHDLGMAICAGMAADCTWEVMTFDAILPAVANGGCEMGLAAIAATPGRRALVDFSEPYDAGGPSAGVFITLDPNQRLRDARIGVQAGTVQQEHLGQRGRAVVTFESNDAALAALARHEIDLLFASPGVLQAAQERQYPGLRALAYEEIPGWGTAVAVARGADGLRKRIDTAIQTLQEDGTIERLRARWFAAGTTT